MRQIKHLKRKDPHTQTFTHTRMCVWLCFKRDKQTVKTSVHLLMFNLFYQGRVYSSLYEFITVTLDRHEIIDLRLLQSCDALGLPLLDVSSSVGSTQNFILILKISSFSPSIVRSFLLSYTFPYPNIFQHT